MPETFSRDHLIPFRLYHEQPTDRYFYTPDGIGCIWFDTKAQALAETGAFDQPVIAINQELED